MRHGMLRKLKWWVLATLLIATPVTWAVETTRVLMLVSYHPGMAWSDAQVAGVRAELEEIEPPIDLQLEYLDTKRVRPSDRYYQELEAVLLTKIGSSPPAMILASDDDALDLALRLRKAHFPRMPVLFSGIAISRLSALEREANIGGVFDDIDVSSSLSAVLRMLPKTRRVVVIHDQSRTSLAQIETLRRGLTAQAQLQIEYLTDISAEAVQDRLAQLGAQDLVFALPFNRDSRGKILTHEEAADLWARASGAPVAVTRDVAMRPGILGGFLISGREQGQAIGRLAQQLISGTASTPLPMTTGPSHATFDHQQIERWGIDRDLLPEQATVVNVPIHAWDELRPHFAWLATLFGSLLIIIGLLVYGMQSRNAAARAIRQSEKNFRDLFDHSPDAIVVRDMGNGQIVDTNPRFEAMFGYTAAQARLLKPQDLTALGPQFNADSAREIFEKVLREGEHFFEWHQQRKDGSQFWSEISMVRVDMGSHTRTVSTVRDISDRKHAEQLARDLEYRIRQIYENLPIAVFAIDADHKVTFWNPEMTRLTGVPAHEVVGTRDSWRGIYPSPRPCLLDVLVDGAQPDDLERYYAGRLRKSSQIPGALEGESYFTNQQKTQGMWGRFCAAPLRDEHGTITGAIETLIDVTQLKRVQTNLEDLNRELEARVDSRNQELQRAMGQLVQSEKLAALGSLVAGVAHELNTPIGNVLAVASTLTEEASSFSQKLLSGSARRSDVERGAQRIQEASLLIERNAARAAKLINDFKEVAVDQTSSRRRRFRLLAIVQEVLHTTRPMFKHATQEVRLLIDEDLELDSYPGPLEQVLTNLLANSIAHGFENRDEGRIDITAQLDGAGVLLHYSDDGRGIPATHLPHIFEPFYTTKLGRGGSGLGMYIVYNLVTNVLAGHIGIESQEGVGTQIRMAIPQSAPLSIT
ncbi:PAS domain S-box protein [Rhodoferax sp.]|uniref:sensor histidine kinase n=1 Tax=Rhodoferax sp. TaxID=50421 RepID=UPI0025E6FA06|nr:PAS domain S-box protein [Rhodoferax sp.]